MPAVQKHSQDWQKQIPRCARDDKHEERVAGGGRNILRPYNKRGSFLQGSLAARPKGVLPHDGESRIGIEGGAAED
jgi:hypothetical protein